MYLITFHSQFDANLFVKKYSEQGRVVRKPVPRELSSSCGTCCSFEPNESTGVDETKLFEGAEYEKVYKVDDDMTGGRKTVKYTLLLEKD